MKRYVMAGLGIMFLGVVSAVHAEMEVKVKDNTANNGFSIKEETTGSTIARFRGDGNVGIGTTDPTAKLEVQNSAKSDLFIFSKQPPAVGNTAELLFSTTNALSLLSNAPRIYSYEEVSGAPWKMGLRFDTFASLPGPGRTTALAITGDGNVGIGTTNPLFKLDINGSLAVGSLDQNTLVNVRTNDIAYATTIKNPTSPTTKAQAFLSMLQKDSLAVGDANQIRLGFFANNDVGVTPDTRFFSAIEAVVEDQTTVQERRDCAL